jgi:hypothetical protein
VRRRDFLRQRRPVDVLSEQPACEFRHAEVRSKRGQFRIRDKHNADVPGECAFALLRTKFQRLLSGDRPYQRQLSRRLVGLQRGNLNVLSGRRDSEFPRWKLLSRGRGAAAKWTLRRSNKLPAGRGMSS